MLNRVIYHNVHYEIGENIADNQQVCFRFNENFVEVMSLKKSDK